MSFSLFRNRLFTASMLSLFFITLTQSAISFLMPFYLQNILHFSPSQMGWIMIANSVVIVMVAPIAGWLSDRMGSRLLCTVGSALIVIAQFFIASLGLDASIPRIVFPLVLTGLGWAIFNSPNQSAILGAVPRDKVGTASGMTTTTARTGGAMGVALSATLFTYGLAAAGLSPLQIESPQSWGAAPEIFVRSFNHTVHIVNFFTLLSIVFSVVEVHGKNEPRACGWSSMTLTGEPAKPRRTSRLILLSVCIGQTIVGLDQRAITVALPTLTTTFHTAFTTIQWTILVYDLVLIGLIITMGRLGDLFGRRRFYSLGFRDLRDRFRPLRLVPDDRSIDFFPRRSGARRIHDRRQRSRHRLGEFTAGGTGSCPRA